MSINTVGYERLAAAAGPRETRQGGNSMRSVARMLVALATVWTPPAGPRRRRPSRPPRPRAPAPTASCSRTRAATSACSSAATRSSTAASSPATRAPWRSTRSCCAACGRSCRARSASYFDFSLMPDFGGGAAVLQDAYLDVQAVAEAPGARRQVQGARSASSGCSRRRRSSFVERAFPTALVPNRDVGVHAPRRARGRRRELRRRRLRRRARRRQRRHRHQRRQGPGGPAVPVAVQEG